MTKRHRDAATGEFTTAEHAAEHPDTTVSETVKPRADLREVIAGVLEIHWLEYVYDPPTGPWFECGCNEDGHLNGDERMTTMLGAIEHQADAIATALEGRDDAPSIRPTVTGWERPGRWRVSRLSTGKFATECLLCDHGWEFGTTTSAEAAAEKHWKDNHDA